MAEARSKPDLPGVDKTQQDTFETPDVPQNNVVGPSFVREDEVRDGESIDRSGLPAKKAFDKFADKSFVTHDKDFSDSVGKRTRRSKTGGFLNKQNNFEISEDQPSPANETPLQRFHRLQHEVKQFVDEVEAASKSQPNAVVEQDITNSELTEQLVALQNQLLALSSDGRTRDALDPMRYVHHHSQLQIDLSKKLLAEMQAAKTEAPSKPADGNSSNTVTYELFYSPDQSKNAQLTKIIDMEKRLADMESLVGKPSGNTPTPLLKMANELSEKLGLLEAPKLDALQQRIKAVSAQIDALPKESALARAGNEKKINDMYDVLTRWDVTAVQLPAIVERLSALRTLHENSVSFGDTIATMSAEQAKITSLLQEDTALLNSVKSAFADNMKTIQGNMTQLETRFAALSAKMDAKKPK